jgi:hypothetical protein
MLMQAVEAEVEAFLAAHADLTDNRGRRRLVRNGHGPERQLQTGIGPVGVSRPRVRDRGGNGSGPIRFSSAILPMIGAADLSATTVRRLTEGWQQEHAAGGHVTSRPATTSISGPMASTSPCDSSMNGSACWC